MLHDKKSEFWCYLAREKCPLQHRLTSIRIVSHCRVQVASALIPATPSMCINYGFPFFVGCKWHVHHMDGTQTYNQSGQLRCERQLAMQLHTVIGHKPEMPASIFLASKETHFKNVAQEIEGKLCQQ